MSRLLERSRTNLNDLATELWKRWSYKAAAPPYFKGAPCIYDFHRKIVISHA